MTALPMTRLSWLLVAAGAGELGAVAAAAGAAGALAALAGALLAAAGALWATAGAVPAWAGAVTVPLLAGPPALCEPLPQPLRASATAVVRARSE